jgi:hypothetical protein
LFELANSVKIYNHRGTGSGFTYNFSRIITAAFPFTIGELVRRGGNFLLVEFCVAVIPAIALVFLCLPWAIETRDMNLYDEPNQVIRSPQEEEDKEKKQGIFDS